MVLPDIFLSYSRDDQVTARRFAEGFERTGFSVWWDQALNPGEAFDKVTEKALEEAKAVVVLWSKHSVDSRWVRAEAMQANSSGKLVPVMIEPCKRPIMFELTHTADLSAWKGDPNDRVWQEFVAGMRRFAQKSEAPGAVLAQPTLGPPKRNIGVGIAVAAATLLAIGAGIWAVSRKGAELVAPAAVAPSTLVTLAVLPFVNLSSDPEQEYFSDGLTEEVLNQLAQIKALRVTGRTSSFAFKGKNEDLRVIGEKLGVANLLEGSIRKDGNQLRITAQLVNSRDGAHQWSQTYARELKDVFAIQEDIAKDVAKALSITLDVGDLNSSQGGTTNVEAYDRYLRGRELYMRDERNATTQAVQQFREAVTLDPSFSRAWLDLSRSLATHVVFFPAEAESDQSEITRANERVKTLAPGTWWAKMIIADELRRERKWSEAEAAINAALADRAERQLPTELAFQYLSLMAGIGRVKEALVVGEQALARDPLAMNLARLVQVTLDCAGRSGDAQAEYERTKAQVGIQGPQELFTLARLLMRDDADPAAIRAQLRVVGESGANPVARKLSLRLYEHFTDRAAALREIRGTFDDPSTEGQVAIWAVSMFADRFGDRDLALAALRKTVFLPQLPLGYLWQPNRMGLRSDPRFKQIVRDLGLVDYWRASGHWGDYCKPVGKEDFECR